MFGKSEVADDYQRTRRPIVAMAKNFPGRHRIAPHRHRRAQLIFAEAGVMTVSSAAGRWVVPPTRAIWIPAGTAHSVETSSRLLMRTLYIEPSVARSMPADSSVVSVSGLLRALILTAVRVPNDYASNGHDARIMRLILDEIHTLQVLPLHLPLPKDARSLAVARRVLAEPGSRRQLDEWAKLAFVSDRTLARLFANELGMSFGRWCQQARLQASLPLLAKRQSILNVALAVGYDSPSAFTYAFKRNFGSTPSEYFSSG